MSLLGWAFMLGSISLVLMMVGYCLFKVLALPSQDAGKHLHGQPAIDTKDTIDAD